MHYEKREVPVVAFVLAKEGKLGPELKAHAEDAPCPTEATPAAGSGVVNGKPAFCNGIFPLPPSTPTHVRFGGRNVKLSFVADTFSAGVYGHPMIDRTGLSGTFDFTLEWAPPRHGRLPSGEVIDMESDGPTFEEAVRDQLGLKLQSTKAPVEVPVVDHVEKPSEN
jgi:uncharacterized protein (TIGR03435 family)